MNVACLVPYPVNTTASQRFRVEQWAKPLAARGIHVDFLPFIGPETMAHFFKPGNFLLKSRGVVGGALERAVWAARRARQYDAVVIHREAMVLGLDWVERYLARRVPTVFDFDDAIWIPAVSPSNRAVGFLKSFDKIDRILGLVDSVTAGCEYLAAHARKCNPNVHLVPTSIDLDTYSPPREHADTDVLTVGWTGSQASAAYLSEITVAVAKAAKRLPMRLSLIGTKSFTVPGVDVVCQEWTPATEISVIRTFDVGLKPARHEDIALGKCPMKDIQYMALGIPCVATKFGTTLESIEHGTNGFLCEKDEDWGDALIALRDTDARRRMGAAARLVVEQRYSSEVAADAFAGALESARRRFRARRPNGAPSRTTTG
jgi:glycosyltransferase involved in cell wall biosynthesis